MKLYVGTVTFCTDNLETGTDHIIICGNSMPDAAERVCKYYGANNVDEISLALINPEAPIVCFQDSTVTDLIKTTGEVY